MGDIHSMSRRSAVKLGLFSAGVSLLPNGSLSAAPGFPAGSGRKGGRRALRGKKSIRRGTIGSPADLFSFCRGSGSHRGLPADESL